MAPTTEQSASSAIGAGSVVHTSPVVLGNWPRTSRGSADASKPLSDAMLTDRLSGIVSGLQQKWDQDTRANDCRFQQVEKQLQTIVAILESDRAKDGEATQRYSAMQGAITGLTENAQALTRRVDSLDERVWARSNTAEETSRQGLRELQQLLQASERESRVIAATTEDHQRKAAAKQQRLDRMIEDLQWRVEKLEECDHESLHGTSEDEEALLSMRAMYDEFKVWRDRVAIFDASAPTATVPEEDADLCEESSAKGSHDRDAEEPDALAALENEFAAFRRQVEGQVEELMSGIASLRVKIDSQSSRQNAFSERLENAHVPATESLRSELLELRARDLSIIEKMETMIAETAEKAEAAEVDLREIPEQLESLRHRASGADATLATIRRELHDLRGVARKASSAVGAAAVAHVDAAVVSGIHQQLAAMADQLEALDNVTKRVRTLEHGFAQHIDSLQPRGFLESPSVSDLTQARPRCGDEGSPARGRQPENGVQVVGEQSQKWKFDPGASALASPALEIGPDESVGSSKDLQDRCDSLEVVMPSRVASDPKLTAERRRGSATQQRPSSRPTSERMWMGPGLAAHPSGKKPPLD